MTEKQTEMIEAILAEKHRIEVECEKRLSHLRSSLIRIQSEIPSDAGIRHFENKSLFEQLGETLNPNNY